MDTSQQAGAAIYSACFFVLLCLNVFNLKKVGYSLYVPIAVSCAFRGVAYACRAAFWSVNNPDYLAVWGALTAAGFGIHVAMLSLLFAGWLKNAPPTAPSVSRAVAHACKFFVACVITFGPVLGVVAAGMLYGGHTPYYIYHANAIRKASQWGLFAVTTFLSILVSSWCLHLLDHSSRREEKAQHLGAGRPKASVYLFGLFVALYLLLLSAIFRGVSTVRAEYLMHPPLYFPLVVLPELLSAIWLSAPFLAAQTGLAGRMEEWSAQRHKSLPPYGSSGPGSADAAAVCEGVGRV